MRGEVELFFQPLRRIVERGGETVRRVVAVDARDSIALLVEQQDGRRELYLEEFRQLFSRRTLPSNQVTSRSPKRSNPMATKCFATLSVMSFCVKLVVISSLQ
jgi:hypothetical protein